MKLSPIQLQVIAAALQSHAQLLDATFAQVQAGLQAFADAQAHAVNASTEPTSSADPPTGRGQ